MLKIRLQRFGKKKAPIYRVAVMEKANQRNGEPVEVLGFYNPKNKELVLNSERAKFWQGKGAIASDTVAALLKKEIAHDLATGNFVAKAKSRAEKEKRQQEIVAASKKNTKAKKKRAEAAAAAKSSEASEAQAA